MGAKHVLIMLLKIVLLSALMGGHAGQTEIVFVPKVTKENSAKKQYAVHVVKTAGNAYARGCVTVPRATESPPAKVDVILSAKMEENVGEKTNASVKRVTKERTVLFRSVGASAVMAVNV